MVSNHNFKRDFGILFIYNELYGLLEGICILTFKTRSNNYNCLGHMVYASMCHPI